MLTWPNGPIRLGDVVGYAAYFSIMDGANEVGVGTFG